MLCNERNAQNIKIQLDISLFSTPSSTLSPTPVNCIKSLLKELDRRCEALHSLKHRRAGVIAPGGGPGRALVRARERLHFGSEVLRGVAERVVNGFCGSRFKLFKDEHTGCVIMEVRIKNLIMLLIMFIRTTTTCRRNPTAATLVHNRSYLSCRR